MLKSPLRNAVLAVLSVSTREEVTAGGVGLAATGTVGVGATMAVGVGALGRVGVGALGGADVGTLGGAEVGALGTVGWQATVTSTRTPVR
jgi:hypothetical protein